MDALIGVIIVAMATAFSTALVELALQRLPVSSRLITGVLTLPVSMGYHYILGTSYPDLIVHSAATSFLAISLGIMIDRVSNTPLEIRRGRRG